MNGRRVITTLILGVCILLTSAVLAQAQDCPPGYSKVVSFGQPFGFAPCVAEVTYCINNTNPTFITILSWRSLAHPPCSLEDPCEIIRQTVVAWEYGACPGDPPKLQKTYTITYCGSTCAYLVGCGAGEHPVITKIGCS